MNFNKHLNLEGKHAFLSASKYHWVNYDDEKLDAVFCSYFATQRGTELHALAAQCIKLGVKLPRTHKTLNSTKQLQESSYIRFHRLHTYSKFYEFSEVLPPT